MDKYDVAILDFNNIFFKTYIIPWKDEDEYTDAQRQQNLKNFLAYMQGLDNWLGEDTKFVMVSDFSIDPNFEKLSSKHYRRQIYPEYKANRKPKRPEVAEDMATVIDVLKTYRDDLHLISVPGYEADDLVGELLDMFKGKRICLVSNDGDWCVNLKQGEVDILKVGLKDLYGIPNSSCIITEEKFKLENEYSPNPGVLIYKCIRGDSGDNIPKGVLRMPEPLVLHCAQAYSSVDQMIQDSQNDDFIPEKWKEKIVEGASQLKLNEKLVGRMRLKEDIDILDYNYDCVGGSDGI